jgi:hypothetical protein
MPHSEYCFRFGMIVSISLLATVSELVVERFFGLNGSTLMVGRLSRPPDRSEHPGCLLRDAGEPQSCPAARRACLATLLAGGRNVFAG